MLLNRPRAHGLMSDLDVDVMVAAMPENVTYLSGYSLWSYWFRRGATTKKAEVRFALLPRDESLEPALVSSRFGTNLSQWPTWIDDLYAWGRLGEEELPDELHPEVAESPEVQQLLDYVGRAKHHGSPAEALVAALTDRGLERSRIALDLEGIPAPVLAAIRAQLPEATILDGGEFFRLVRAVKTPEEIGNLRRAAEINEEALRAIVDATAVGVTEQELAILYRTTVSQHGGIPGFINVYAGKRSGTMWEPTDREIRPGELVWMDGGCTYRYYHADTGSCAVVGGEPTEDMRHRFAALDAGLQSALETVRAGVRCSEVTTAMHDAMLAAGAPKTFGFGHAIGLEPRDLPMLQPPYRDHDDDILSGSSDIPLEADMVINLEAPYREWNLGALQAEYTIRVTDTGYEPLIPQERPLHVR